MAHGLVFDTRVKPLKKRRAGHDRSRPSPLRCPRCDSRNLVMTDSRPNKGNTVVRRRRGCRDCEHRWTTFEVAAAVVEALTGAGYEQIMSRLDAMEELCRSLRAGLAGMAAMRVDEEDGG